MPIILSVSKSLYSQKQFSADNLANMVVCISGVIDNKIRPLGTATIISDSLRYFLVTASHVTDSIKGACYLIFRSPNDNPVALPLQNFIKGKIIRWTNHKEADVSVIEIRPFDEGSQTRLAQWSFPIKQILGERRAVPRETNVTIMGYPVIDEIGEHFSPFTFNSYFSSGLITMRRADTKNQATFQLLEDPSVQGYSGGPVMIGIRKVGVTTGPSQTVLVGIVHGTRSDNTGGKLAMITPAYYIWEILK